MKDRNPQPSKPTPRTARKERGATPFTLCERVDRMIATGSTEASGTDECYAPIPDAPTNLTTRQAVKAWMREHAKPGQAVYPVRVGEPITMKEEKKVVFEG